MMETNKYIRVDNFLRWDKNDEIVMEVLYDWSMALFINMVGIVVEESVTVYLLEFPYIGDKQWWFYKADTKPATQEEYDRCVVYAIEKALRRG